MKRTEHKWDKNDTIIALYYAKFGWKHLPVKSENDVAESIVGCSLDPFLNQVSNVNYTLGKRVSQNVSGFSKTQKNIIEELKNKPEEELRDIVLEIINDPDRQNTIVERVRKLQEIHKELKVKEEKKKLDAIFRKMGKDPSKMRSVGIRPKE